MQPYRAALASTGLWALLSSSLRELTGGTLLCNAGGEGVSGGPSSSRTLQDGALWNTTGCLRSSGGVRTWDFALNSLSSSSPVQKVRRCLTSNRVRAVLERNLNLFKSPDLNLLP